MSPATYRRLLRLYGRCRWACNWHHALRLAIQHERYMRARFGKRMAARAKRHRAEPKSDWHEPTRAEQWAELVSIARQMLVAVLAQERKRVRW